MSDKEIVERSALLNHLLPGDVILADRRGLHVTSMLKWKTPPFTKGKKQLEKVDINWSCEISAVRIHVEHVTGVLKKNYTTILESILPLLFVSSNLEHDKAAIDKLVKLCCANLTPSVIIISNCYYFTFIYQLNYQTLKHTI